MTYSKKMPMNVTPAQRHVHPIGVGKKSTGHSAKKSAKRPGRFVSRDDLSRSTPWDAFRALEDIDPNISPVETIRQLSDIREEIDLTAHEANRLLRLTAYKAAVDIKADSKQFALFLHDPFFDQNGIKTKKLENDQSKILRYAMIRIFGYQDGGRKASKEAIKLQPAYDADEPLSVVKALLSQKKDIKNAGGQNGKASPACNATLTFDVPGSNVNAVHRLPEVGLKTKMLKLKVSNAPDATMLLVCVSKSNAKAVQFVNVIEKLVAVSNGSK